MAGETTQTAALATIPAGVPIATDVIGAARAPAAGDRLQYVKLDVGAAGASSPITSANPLPVSIVADGGAVQGIDDNGGSLTVDSPQLPAALAAGGGIKVEGVAGGVAQPVSIAAAVAVTDNAGSLTTDTPQLPAALTGSGNLKVSLQEDGGAVIGVDDNGGSLTIDATSLPLPTGASTEATLATRAADATLTGGTAKSIARGGAKGATAAADLTSTAEGADHQALDVQLYHGGAAKDPTQIRALTNADVVKAQLQDNGGTAVTVGQKVMASSLPVVIASDQSSLPTVGVPETTYHALFRLAARPYALSKASIAANSRTQFATLFHGAASTKRLRLRRVLVMFESETVAGMITFDLVRLTAATTPATGNPAITPAPAATGTAEATALALPTTGGTEGALIADLEFNVGITGAVGTTNPPQPDQWFELFSEDEQNPMGEQQALEIAAGVAGGWAVVVDNVGATNTVKCKVKMVFTEK